MGYHLILREENGDIQHEYCECFHELAYYPIKENSIIYKGEKHWKPFLVKNSSDYKDLSNSRFRGSLQAEQVFMKQALEQGYMIEAIDQSRESFEQYYKAFKEFKKIKRGDFLIRNVGNLEIEVKCKTIYWKNKKPYFYFEKDHLEKHLKMQEFTNTAVILAIYERDSKKEDCPKPEKLFMVDMNYISEKIVKAENLKPSKRDWGDAYCIPLKKCMKGFKLVDYYKERMNKEEEIKKVK